MLEILDTAGQEEFTARRYGHIDNAHCFLLVYSIKCRWSYSEVDEFMNDIIRRKEDTKKYPVVIVGNKTDLEAEREVYRDELETLKSKYNCEGFEITAKDPDQVSMVVERLASLAMNNIVLLPSIIHKLEQGIPLLTAPKKRCLLV